MPFGNPPPQPVKVEAAAITFSGSLSERAVSALITAIHRSRSNRLIISSLGGDEVAAAKLSHYIKSNKIAVIARKYCLSSCVYVLLAGNKSIVDEDTLLGLHAGALAVYPWTMSTNTDSGRKAAEGAKAAFIALSSLSFSNAAVALLKKALPANDPICVRQSKSDRGRWEIGYRYTIWVPSGAFLESVGIALPRSWPKTGAEAVALTAKYLRTPGLIRYGNFDEKAPLNRLSECLAF